MIPGPIPELYYEEEKVKGPKPFTLNWWMEIRDWARDNALEMQEAIDIVSELKLPFGEQVYIDGVLLERYLKEKALFNWIDHRVKNKYGE